jgi:CubicO group peptidase (beta-lactamase class C family)
MMLLKKTFAPCLFATLSALTVFTQNATILKLDSFFTTLDANKKAMGSIVISKNGETVYQKTIGYSLYTANEKITANEKTKYRIGSISKIFTAVIVFQLIEEGKITLGTTLDNYFPGLPNAKLITISNLLNHRSGIPDIKTVRARQKKRTHEQMLKIITDKKGWTIPDTLSSYSNSNYLLLGYIIEKTTGKLYSEVLHDRIVTKTGLTDSYFGQDINISNNECFSYCFKRKWKKQRQTDMSIPGASGGIISTPADLARFIEVLFSDKLISQHNLERMKTITNDYGMGLVQYELDTKKAYGHPGGMDRFESVVAYFPGDSVAVAYCSNGQVYPVIDIVTGALRIWFGKAYTIPGFTPTVIRPATLKKYEGLYSNAAVPFNITIRKHKYHLIAEPTGHSSYELQSVSPGKFRYDAAGVAIEFDHLKHEMKLNQGGRCLTFKKQN